MSSASVTVHRSGPLFMTLLAIVMLARGFSDGNDYMLPDVLSSMFLMYYVFDRRVS